MNQTNTMINIDQSIKASLEERLDGVFERLEIIPHKRHLVEAIFVPNRATAKTEAEAIGFQLTLMLEQYGMKDAEVKVRYRAPIVHIRKVTVEEIK